ncbi:TRAP transporter substrate-binding protein [Pseudalkalibacillus salsuginis]|uniref:TRAP transporter substrate-binding protein n=1 Tax=Pseudalkalibacillus salsuginis TaxID=2910972 RepID=UPI001F1629C6|nr:TRAP transporter substrate-binding protein [Pseudalkalibacillus salsuginis]MCF6411340.1 TRAP transporter substrate-binding protein [Pseudalkalibacillus salsuginis]
MKKCWVFLCLVLLSASLLLAGCNATGLGEAGGDNTQTLKVANYFASEHPQNVALREKFKPLVEEGSEGTLKVEIYDNSQLGAEQEFYDGVRNGTIEMGIPGMIMQSSIEKLGVTEWPFLFKDYEHAKNVLNGPIGDELLEDLEEKHGVHPLAWSANGFRMFSSNKELASVEDFKDLRLRMPNIEHYIDLGKALGATVSPMPISEVFTALEQNVVDGQDNPIATLRASGWYEVQDYVLESRHMFSPNLYIINSKVWEGLSEDQQKVVQEAAQKSADYEFELMQKSYEEDKKFLEDKGIEFITPSKEFQKEMEEATEPLYESYYEKFPWAEDIVERIKEQAN